MIKYYAMSEILPTFSAFEDFSKTCAALMLCAALAVILKNFGFKGAPLFTAVCFLFFISEVLSSFAKISDVFSFLGDTVDAEKYIKAVLKIIGVGYLSGISSDVCAELGEGGLARCVTLIARLELLVIAMPFVYEILEASFSLLDV